MVCNRQASAMVKIFLISYIFCKYSVYLMYDVAKIKKNINFAPKYVEYRNKLIKYKTI